MANPDKSRPELSEDILIGIKTKTEEFQNRVLRPIIKMQSDVLMWHMQGKLSKLKSDWNNQNFEERRNAMTQLLTKDKTFKHEIIGIVLGQFSLEEYRNYMAYAKEINKRITQIVLNRSLDLILRENI